jgi:hypothetical protein
LKGFEHALLIGGATTSLLAGVATAELGLAPIRQAVAAETTPSLDTATADTPEPTKADLSSGPQASPPAVIVPVSASTPRTPRIDTADAAQQADDAGPPADDGDAREDATLGRAPEASPATRPEGRGSEQERDTPFQDVDPPRDASSPAAPD